MVRSDKANMQSAYIVRWFPVGTGKKRALAKPLTGVEDGGNMGGRRS